MVSPSNSVLRYVKLKKFFDLFVGRKKLDCLSEDFLEKIMLNWDEGIYLSESELIASCSEIGSRSVLAKQLQTLLDLGLVECVDTGDTPIKIVSPTQETIEYYRDLAMYIEKCFDSGAALNYDPNSLLVKSDLLSQEYLQAQAQALAAYTLAVDQVTLDKTIPELMSDVCKAITSQPLYICACVGFAKIDPNATIEIVAAEGRAKKYSQRLQLSWDPMSEFGSGPTAIAFRTRKTVAISDTEMAANFGPWAKNAKKFDIRSTVSVPLLVDKKSVGVMIVYADKPNSFGPVEIHLLEKLADQLALAIKQEKK